MIKKTYSYTILLSISLFLMFSCAKDEEIAPMDKENALELISNTSLLMDQTVNQVMENEGVILMNRFMALAENAPTELRYILSSNLVSLQSNFTFNIYSPKEASANDTPFGNYGTYTWSNADLNWVFESNPVDQIVYLFPTDDSDDENSASLTVSQIQQDAESEGFVNRFVVSLKSNQIEVLKIDYAANLSENSIDRIILDIIFSPYTLTTNQQFDYSNESTLITSSNTFKNQGVTLLSSKLEINTAAEVIISPENIDEINDDQIDDVLGYVQIGSVKFTLDLSLSEFNNEPELSLSDSEILANKELKIKLYEYPSGTPIAYVKWYSNPDDNAIEPFLVFSDGSEELAIDYLPESFVEYLEDDDLTKFN